jgi:hypothetical protein
VAVDLVGRHAGSGRFNQRSTCDLENEGMTDNFGCMLYSVYAVLRICCTRCMLYSLLTHDHCMER